MYSPLIGPAELFEKLGSEGLRLVDCRFSLSDPEAGARLYAASHLPGATYAHLERDLSSPIVPGQTGRHPLPDAAAFSATLSRWGWTRDTAVVAYDAANGALAAARLWWMLRLVGAREAAVLDGGIAAWTRAGFALDASVVRREPARVDVAFDPAQIVYTDALL